MREFIFAVTFPNGKPRSFKHVNIIFSVLPDANVRVTLKNTK